VPALLECGRGKAAEARSIAFRSKSRRLCRAIFRYILWQISKDPASAMKQLKGIAASEIELLKQHDMKRAFQEVIDCGKRPHRLPQFRSSALAASPVAW
jgi:hypothetical protein